MGTMVSIPHRPNHKVLHEAVSATTWAVIATDGTAHATLAAMATAGKKPWPGVELGNMTGVILTLRSEAAGVDGGAFYYAVNRDDASFGSLANDGLRDNEAALVSGSGQTRDIEGPIRNIWRRKLTAGDELILDLAY